MRKEKPNKSSKWVSRERVREYMQKMNDVYLSVVAFNELADGSVKCTCANCKENSFVIGRNAFKTEDYMRVAFEDAIRLTKTHIKMVHSPRTLNEANLPR